MARIPVIDPQTATGEAKTLLDAVQSSLGMVPNFIRVLANSPTALQAFLGLHGIAGAGVLDPLTRERIALTVAEQNACQYCVSEIVEIITHVAMNIFTNILGKATQVEIDFPKVALNAAA